MVNSSWTQSHIKKLWRIPNCTKQVYPPCDTSALQVLPLERLVGRPKIMSVAQFRPEKAHSLQLGERLLNLKNKAAILKNRWGCRIPQEFKGLW
ncbi:hypothetical protein SLEP1_g5913 [Rubroshorea leprosula]|uniref:Uncharacterized protein n=1 Tax=Rubroshorea leprosula TaxID=152421 RepID=A0AAV5I1K8_9ROSI|nr:hypothetical protein SLEP1_g5913 [Rubroshorea leprosula]